VRSGGSLQGPCARIDDHGCSRRVELGLDRNCSSSRTTLAIPRTRCPRPVRTPSLARKGAHPRIAPQGKVRECAHRSLPAPPATVTQGRACPGFGWSTRARFEELGGCVHVSYRVAEVVRRSRSPKKLLMCLGNERAGGERGLAQSGRPRRAKRLRVSSHGGKTVRSTPACEGIRKGVAVAGLRSMEGASGRSSRPLFTRGRGKRSRPIFPSVIAKSMTCEGWVTEASEVGCSRATTAGEKHPLQGARANRRSVRSAVKARHTPKPRAQARWGRSPNDTRVLVDVVCFGICWSYASLRARHPSPQGDGAGSPSHERTHRAVDADAGQGRGERVRDVRLRGRSRNEHPSTAQVVVARYDSRRSECGGARS